MSLSTAAQDAVYSALIADSALDALLARHSQFARAAIYDHVPQAPSGDNSRFPFVTIGEDTLADWSTDTASGAEITVVIHIWSRADGWKEAKDIDGAVYDALHRQTLTAPGYEFIDMHYESSEAIRDPDGETLHIAATYRMTIDQQGFGL